MGAAEVSEEQSPAPAAPATKHLPAAAYLALLNAHGLRAGSGLLGAVQAAVVKGISK
jgi:hypothetical protein